jgi:soluble cytochrome b562
MSDTARPQTSPEQALLRTQEVMRILGEWGINSDAQIAVLGCQEQIKPRDMKKYQEGMKVLPVSEDINARIEHILGIAHALHTSYPSRPEAGASWMGQRNGKLRGRTPIQCILQDGRRGMVKIRTTVDCAWAWHQDDELNPCWDKQKD